MGNCCNNSPEASKNKRLNDELTKAKQDDRSMNKLLFLGAGGSGKSTVFKQLKRIHGEGWDDAYCLSFMEHIHFQIIKQMQISIEGVAVLAEQDTMTEYGDDYTIPDDFNPYSSLSFSGQKAAERVKAFDENILNEEMGEAIKILWNESVIKNIYSNRANMRIEDSSAYFWDKIDDIMTPQYVPNETDILFVRLRSTGVQQQQFTVKNASFHLFDVGGQKSERKKWIHCFENVTAMIFVVSLSCYDEVMFEDEKMNSMTDSLQLFDNICNNKWFKKTSIILFLNKKDLFQIKLQESKSIKLCTNFQDYDGDTKSFEENAKYIEKEFQNKNKSKRKTIYSHLTCATDKENVNKVFYDVQKIVIEGAIYSGF